MDRTSLIDLAFRQRLATLVVAATGLGTFAATATGYTRSSGSFLTDGFTVGMQVKPLGFSQTDYGVIIGLTATTMTIDGGRTAQSAGSNRSLTAGLPRDVVFENITYTPNPALPYVEGELVPQPSSLLSFPAQSGTREDRGLYVVRWNGIAGTGALGMRRAADALLALFTPGTAFAAGSDVVRVRGDSAPFASLITQRPSGHALVTLTIPWRMYRSNTVSS